MKKKTLIFLLTCWFFSVLQAKDQPQIVVALDGSGDYTSIQAAINAVPESHPQRTVIFIKNGVYDQEKLIIPSKKNYITLRGEDREKTIISYHIFDCNSPESGNKCPADAWQLWKDNPELIRTSATLTINGDNCTLENLTVRNTAGPVGQALAVTLKGDQLKFIDCNFLGYQDTVLLGKDWTRNYFLNCLILGRTDYIFGGGIAWFQSCEIRSYGGGWITAPSTALNQPYGYVFSECRFTYAAGSPRDGDDDQPVAIGRPWHHYPKVAILNSYLCAQIHPEGWPTVWNMPYASTSPDLHLYEYNNTGAGADMSRRANWVAIRRLSAQEAENYTIEKVIGDPAQWK